MKQVRSYCKNAMQVVKISKNITVPHTSYLASLDIESLYTSSSFVSSSESVDQYLDSMVYVHVCGGHHSQIKVFFHFGQWNFF